MRTLGERTREARGRRKRKDIAAKAGMAYSTLADIENDNTSKCTSIAALAAALGVRPEWLESGSGSMLQDHATPINVQSISTPQPVAIDPILSALTFLEKECPAKAMLFRAQILAAEEDLRRAQHQHHRRDDPPAPPPKQQAAG